MSETPDSGGMLPSIRVIRYFVIADGKRLFEDFEEKKALRFFLDNRSLPNVKDIALVIKQRELPASGKYPDIDWT